MSYYISTIFNGTFDEPIEITAVDPLASMQAVENEDLQGF